MMTGPMNAVVGLRVDATAKPAPISTKPNGTTILVPRRWANGGRHRRHGAGCDGEGQGVDPGRQGCHSPGPAGSTA